MTPINEQNLDTARTTSSTAPATTPLADGRIFFSAGHRLPQTGCPTPARSAALTYSRVYNPAHRHLHPHQRRHERRPAAAPAGEKWYPTNMLLPDGRVLIFGGFHCSAGGPRAPRATTRSRCSTRRSGTPTTSANPYTVLTQHEEGVVRHARPPAATPTCSCCPRPVPAGSASGLRPLRRRCTAASARCSCSTTSPDPTGAQRLFARPNAPHPQPQRQREGRGRQRRHAGRRHPAVHQRRPRRPAGSPAVYFYNPYADSWTTLDTGISRMYGNAVQLPDGEVLIINGYQGPGRQRGRPTSPATPADIANPVGDVRAADARRSLRHPAHGHQPAASGPSPPTAATTASPLLLKDGRILIGGGKDVDHATGCEKNELRIYEPPYLQGGGPRPAISTPGDGATMTVGGPAGHHQLHRRPCGPTRGVVLMAPGLDHPRLRLGPALRAARTWSGRRQRHGHRQAAVEHQHRPADRLHAVPDLRRRHAVGRACTSGCCRRAACVYAVNGGDTRTSRPS